MPKHDPHSGGPGSNQYGKKPKQYTADDVVNDAIGETIGADSGMDDPPSPSDAAGKAMDLLTFGTSDPAQTTAGVISEQAKQEAANLFAYGAAEPPSGMPDAPQDSPQMLKAKQEADARRAYIQSGAVATTQTTKPITLANEGFTYGTGTPDSTGAEKVYAGADDIGTLSPDANGGVWFFANPDSVLGDADARHFDSREGAMEYVAQTHPKAAAWVNEHVTKPQVVTAAKDQFDAAAALSANDVASVRKARWDARQSMVDAIGALEGAKGMTKAEQVQSLDDAADRAYEAAMQLRAAARHAEARDLDAHQAQKMGAGGLGLPSLTGEGFVTDPEQVADDMTGWAVKGQADGADDWLKGLGEDGPK